MSRQMIELIPLLCLDIDATFYDFDITDIKILAMRRDFSETPTREYPQGR